METNPSTICSPPTEQGIPQIIESLQPDASQMLAEVDAEAFRKLKQHGQIQHRNSNTALHNPEEYDAPCQARLLARSQHTSPAPSSQCMLNINCSQALLHHTQKTLPDPR
jgi:hypothetical protein